MAEMEDFGNGDRTGDIEVGKQDTFRTKVAAENFILLRFELCRLFL